jgi:hypothetical protein
LDHYEILEVQILPHYRERDPLSQLDWHLFERYKGLAARSIIPLRKVCLPKYPDQPRIRCHRFILIVLQSFDDDVGPTVDGTKGEDGSGLGRCIREEEEGEDLQSGVCTILVFKLNRLNDTAIEFMRRGNRGGMEE